MRILSIFHMYVRKKVTQVLLQKLFTRQKAPKIYYRWPYEMINLQFNKAIFE